MQISSCKWKHFLIFKVMLMLLWMAPWWLLPTSTSRSPIPALPLFPVCCRDAYGLARRQTQFAFAIVHAILCPELGFSRATPSPEVLGFSRATWWLLLSLIIRVWPRPQLSWDSQPDAWEENVCPSSLFPLTLVLLSGMAHQSSAWHRVVLRAHVLNLPMTLASQICDLAFKIHSFQKII